MTSGLVITHERRALRAGMLRPHIKGQGTRLVESRSVHDLALAVLGHPVPVVVIDVGDQPTAALAALEALSRSSSDPLVAVLDPRRHAGLADAASELGATLTWPGVVTPPQLVNLVRDWLGLASRRAETSGWFAGPASESNGPTPWERLLAGEDPAPFLDALLIPDVP